jgi:hypothetical protein
MYLRPSPTEPDIRFGRLPDRRVAARGLISLPLHLELHCLSPLRRGFLLCAEHDRQAWRWKSSIQPDGGEGLAKRKGVIARRRPEEAWSKVAARWTRTG